MHALKEAERVLVPKGTMIDVRPLSVNVPLEIIYKGGRESAGDIDMSPTIQYDFAADKAIEEVLKEGLYQEVFVEYFDFAFYWKTINAMKKYIDEKWTDQVIISEEVIELAREMLNKKHPQTQIRIGNRMKLGKYEKLG